MGKSTYVYVDFCMVNLKTCFLPFVIFYVLQAWTGGHLESLYHRRHLHRKPDGIPGRAGAAEIRSAIHFPIQILPKKNKVLQIYVCECPRCPVKGTSRRSEIERFSNQWWLRGTHTKFTIEKSSQCAEGVDAPKLGPCGIARVSQCALVLYHPPRAPITPSKIKKKKVKKTCNPSS